MTDTCGCESSTLGAGVIPKPRQVRTSAGCFIVDGECRIVSGPSAAAAGGFAADRLADAVRDCLGLCLPVVHGADSTGSKTVRMNLQKLVNGEEMETTDAERFAAEGYVLTIRENGVTIDAPDPRGLFYGVMTFIQLLRSGPSIPCGQIMDYPALAMRGLFVILVADLRWYPGSQTPTLDWLKDLVRTLSAFKINTLMIEYGDKFPFRRHAALNHAEAFSLEEIGELVACAAQHHVQVVPLLQCLGHLDYILAQPEYAHLGEGGPEGRQVCPSNPGSFALFTELATELLEAHPDATCFHIGGDETRELGECPQCREKAATEGKGRLYGDHVSQVCQWVKEHGKAPIVWDDMLSAYPEVLASFDRSVRIMYWDYRTALDPSPFMIARSEAHGVVCDRCWEGRQPEAGSPLEQAVFEQPQAVMLDLARDLGKDFMEVYAPYLGDDFPRTVRPFPYLEYYGDKGFRVIGAPSVHGSAMGYVYPQPTLSTANINLFSRRLVEQRADGVVATWWMSEAIPFEACWYSVVAAAESAWHAGPLARQEFDPRFSHQFLHVDDPEIVEALYALEGGEIPYAQSYFHAGETLDEKIACFEASDGLAEQLDRLRKRRQQVNKAMEILQRQADRMGDPPLAVRHLCLAARMIIHKSNQVLALHDIASSRHTPESADDLNISQLKSLQAELLELKAETRDTFGRGMQPLSVEEELKMRFGEEAALIETYLQRLLKSAEAEG